MLHERIKIEALRSSSADRIIFGESRKAHAHGVGGMIADISEDRLLIKLNSSYDVLTDITLYTESIVKSIKSCVYTLDNVNVSKLYKESKLKGILNKVWAWFKKIGAYIASIPKRTIEFFKRKFGKKKDVNKTKPNESTKAVKEQFLLSYDASVSVKAMEAAKKASDAEAIARMVEDGVKAGISSISSKSAGRGIKYSSSELKRLASIVLATVSNGDAMTLKISSSFDRSFYEAVKGTEYEVPFVTALTTAIIVASQEIPYFPAKAEEYAKSLGAKKGFFDDTLFRTDRTAPRGESVVSNFSRALQDAYEHVAMMAPLVMQHEWGKYFKDKKVAIPDMSDDMIKAAEFIQEGVDEIGDIASHTNDNLITHIESTAKEIEKSIKILHPLESNPEKCIAYVSVGDTETFKSKDISSIFDLVDINSALDELADPIKMNEAIQDGIERNRNITEETLARAFGILIGALKDIPKLVVSANKIFVIMLTSAYDVMEEMMGFFGTTCDFGNVPLTSIAATIAHDQRMRDTLLKRVGLI